MANAKRARRTTANTRRIKHTTIKRPDQTHDIKQDMAMQRRNKTSLQANSRETDLWRP